MGREVHRLWVTREFKKLLQACIAYRRRLAHEQRPPLFDWRGAGRGALGSKMVPELGLGWAVAHGDVHIADSCRGVDTVGGRLTGGGSTESPQIWHLPFNSCLNYPSEIQSLEDENPSRGALITCASRVRPSLILLIPDVPLVLSHFPADPLPG